MSLADTCERLQRVRTGGDGEGAEVEPRRLCPSQRLLGKCQRFRPDGVGEVFGGRTDGRVDDRHGPVRRPAGPIASAPASAGESLIPSSSIISTHSCPLLRMWEKSSSPRFMVSNAMPGHGRSMRRKSSSVGALNEVRTMSASASASRTAGSDSKAPLVMTATGMRVSPRAPWISSPSRR